jgi:hypothetical protein
MAAGDMFALCCAVLLLLLQLTLMHTPPFFLKH